jgi:hypothetical protein
LQKRLAAGIAAGALLLGSAGATLVLPGLAAAADPTASPSATATTPGTNPGSNPGTTDVQGDHGGRGGHGGPGGLDADDLTAAAKALGMTEADLTTALNGGKTAATVAKDKGVAIAKVIDAIVAADKAEIAAAVKAGTMTQAQADQQLADLAAHVTDEVNGVAGGHGGKGDHGGPGGLDADDLTAAAKALGLTEADLTTALNSGKTAAAVAKEKGIDVQKVIDAIVAADKAELAAAVKAGTMTQAQADAMIANLSTHVTDEVNGVAGGPGGKGDHGHGFDGQGPAAQPSASPSTSGSGTSG